MARRTARSLERCLNAQLVSFGSDTSDRQFSDRRESERAIPRLDEQERSYSACSIPSQRIWLVDSASHALWEPAFTITQVPNMALMHHLCAKYPLYNINGMSVPVNRYEYEKAKQPIHKPLAHLFKKDNRFTSRMSNPNDYHAPVDSAHFAFV